VNVIYVHSFQINTIGKLSNTHDYIAENTPRKSYLCPISTHAELASFEKYCFKTNHSYTKKPKRMPRVNILVIRLSRTNEIKHSRPCYHCIQTFQRLNIIIDRVYYSDQSGNIVCEKFNDMKDSDKNKVTSGYRRRNW
jgi:hypothetical protein